MSDNSTDHTYLAKLVTPIHAILQRISASDIENVGIFPERLTFMYTVSHERETKFTNVIKRILAAEQTFEFRSPLCVFVSRSVQLLPHGELDFSEWLVQFQINKSKDYDRTIVENQVEVVLFELESFLFD